MKTDGVTFVDSVVKDMTKEEFIEAYQCGVAKLERGKAPEEAL